MFSVRCCLTPFLFDRHYIFIVSFYPHHIVLGLIVNLIKCIFAGVITFYIFSLFFKRKFLHFILLFFFLSQIYHTYGLIVVVMSIKALIFFIWKTRANPDVIVYQ